MTYWLPWATPDNKFRQEILGLRIDAKMSVDEAAEAFGVDRDWLFRIETELEELPDLKTRVAWRRFYRRRIAENWRRHREAQGFG